MSGKEQRYLSYLLRLWQVKTSSGLVWRASLESSRTGELMRVIVDATQTFEAPTN